MIRYLRYPQEVATRFPFCRSLSAFIVVVLLAGCHGDQGPSASDLAKARQQAASQRQQMEQIPPPVKSRYMAVRSYDAWENPYITVDSDMLTVHILFADVNPSSFGAGGMLRPTGARRQQVNIALSKLGDAMVAIPANAWPYGRVIGVEEAHQTPGKEEQMLRRNLEYTVSVLNDLGLVAYDLSNRNLR